MRKTVGEWLRNAAGTLEPIAGGREEAWIQARRLASFGLGKTDAWLIAHDDERLTAPQKKTLDRLLRRRIKREPMEYILDSAPFFGREFFVDKRVLIPRPETEDLIEEALKIPSQTYVDIGTGSGAIAVTLALESPRSVVLASDTGAKALVVAKKNARKLGARVKFFKGNLLHPALRKAIKGPITICANLPYLPLSDKTIMPKSVTGYEPAKALFSKDDGMAVNKKLLIQLSKLLSTHYFLLSILLEFDPPQSQNLLAFAQSLFPHATITIIKDRCGRERILKIRSPLLLKERR